AVVRGDAVEAGEVGRELIVGAARRDHDVTSRVEDRRGGAASARARGADGADDLRVRHVVIGDGLAAFSRAEAILNVEFDVEFNIADGDGRTVVQRQFDT